MKKTALASAAVIIAALGIMFFIHFSNDHIECKTITESKINADGIVVKSQSHICKEKYSF